MNKNDVVQYNHKGKDVFVVDRFRGRHKNICLCHQDCGRFVPEAPEKHCGIALQAYKLSRYVGLVLVMECNQYYNPYVPDDFSDDFHGEGVA